MALVLRDGSTPFEYNIMPIFEDDDDAGDALVIRSGDTMFECKKLAINATHSIVMRDAAELAEAHAQGSLKDSAKGGRKLAAELLAQLIKDNGAHQLLDNELGRRACIRCCWAVQVWQQQPHEMQALPARKVGRVQAEAPSECPAQSAPGCRCRQWRWGCRLQMVVRGGPSCAGGRGPGGWRADRWRAPLTREGEEGEGERWIAEVRMVRRGETCGRVTTPSPMPQPRELRAGLTSPGAATSHRAPPPPPSR